MDHDVTSVAFDKQFSGSIGRGCVAGDSHVDRVDSRGQGLKFESAIGCNVAEPTVSGPLRTDADMHAGWNDLLVEQINSTAHRKTGVQGDFADVDDLAVDDRFAPIRAGG